MRFTILMHPKGHLAAEAVDLNALQVTYYGMSSFWDDQQKQRDLARLVAPTRDALNKIIDNLKGEGFVVVCEHEMLDEEPSAMQNALHALLTAFDAHRDPVTRDTSRYLAPFRATLDQMLHFIDAAAPVAPVAHLQDLPLTDISLLVGITGPSRYDWSLA